MKGRAGGFFQNTSLLTHTASIIISRHQEAEARQRAEQALRTSEERAAHAAPQEASSVAALR